MSDDTIFWLPEGPKISWENDVLHIEDLNPEVTLQWRMSPELLKKLGENCLRVAEGKEPLSLLDARAALNYAPESRSRDGARDATAPDPAEAMRAKCEAIVRGHAEKYGYGPEAIDGAIDAIAALKGAPQ